MPKETFFNLPEEKRRLIEEVAIDEFSAYGYDKSSTNRIVEKCQISKGSFYQYFKDKKDLFKHIIDRVTEEKVKFMSPILQNPEEVDFFTLLRELYLSGLRYADANPKLVIIGNQMLKNKEHPVYSEIMRESKNISSDIFGHLLKLAKSRNEIKENVDIKYISYLITSLNVSTLEYYFDVIKHSDNTTQKIDEDIMNTVDLFIDFIKSGIGYFDHNSEAY